MKWTVVLFLFVGFTLGAPAASAQVTPGQNGLSFAVNNSIAAGTLCGGFSCIPDPVSVSAGDLVTIRITGAPLAPFSLGISATANQCLSFPGVVNALVLDFPILPFVDGFLSNPSPILACPAGMQMLQGTFPASIAPGTTFYIQGLTFGSGFVAAFSQTIEVNVI